MKRLVIVLSAAVLAIPALASAQSAKSAVQVSNLVLVPETTGANWAPILSTSIRTSQQKDLVLGVSLETGLFTQTQVRTKGSGAQLDTSWAESSVVVRVVIDKGTPAERYAYPNSSITVPSFNPSSPTVTLDGIVFDRRGQQLQAVLGFALTGCVDDADDDGGAIQPDECTGVTEQMIDLALRTLAAHSFNFALDDLGSGVHTADVEATVITDKGCEAPSTCSAAGMIGRGSLMVEEVRLVKEQEGFVLQ